MKYLMLILLASAAQAAPPLFYPGESGALEKDAIIEWHLLGCSARWHYDRGNKWGQALITGNTVECAAFVAREAAKVAAGQPTVVQLNHAEKDALWGDYFGGTNPVDPASPDAIIYAAAIAKPWPEAVPPSGLVTKDGVVYVLSQTRDKVGKVAVGRVPLTTPCDNVQTITINPSTGKQTLRIMPVNRALVTWLGTVRGEALFSICN